MTNYPKAFEGDQDLANTFIEIVNKFKPDLLIETGTHLGNTTKFLVSLSLPVLVTEKDPNFVNLTKQNVGNCSNLKILEGDSAEMLKQQFEYLKDKKILAFLDAHWGGGFVLERELEFMATLPIKPFLIIHDFYNPEHPEFGYDWHDKHPYNFEYYEPYFNKIYGDNYKYQYNNSSKSTQGVIFLKPN